MWSCRMVDLITADTGEAEVWGPAPRKLVSSAAMQASALLREVALLKRPWGVSRQGTQHKPAMCIDSKEGQLHPGLYNQKNNQEVEGINHFLLLSTP